MALSSISAGKGGSDGGSEEQRFRWEEISAAGEGEIDAYTCATLLCNVPAMWNRIERSNGYRATPMERKENEMKKLACLLAVLLFAGAEACGGQPSNLLIGTWKLDRSGAAPSVYCQEPITFAEKSRTMPAGVQGGANTIPVKYVAGDPHAFPTVVYVMTDAGVANHTTFNFVSKDRMILDTALQCVYVRQ